jgi:hypothetical protein
MCVLTTTAWGTYYNIELSEYGVGYENGSMPSRGIGSPPLGGGWATLYYNLGVTVVNNGDLVIYESGSTTDISDVWRFVGSQVFLYSKLGPAYADTGIPTLWTPQSFTQELTSYNDYIDYTPSPSQVGYISGGVRYTPEPATISLLGLGGLAMLRRRK